MKTSLMLVLVIVLFSANCFAQFQTNNDAIALGGDFYRLTDSTFNQGGSLWYQIEHDLTKPFNVVGKMYFGKDPGGADGIAFVFQNGCLNAGSSGGGIGYAAMPQQSIAIEFDTYQNTAATGSYENHDPAYDHVAVEKMGVVDHGDPVNNLYGPIQAHATKTNIKDDTWYDFQISYNPTSHDLTLYFDNTLRFVYNYDILANVFAGDPYVYWGFTSSTGGHYNYQEVYINKALTTYTLKDTTICPGASVSVSLPSLAGLAGKNNALNKTAVSAPSYISSPSEAIDGNQGTRWESQQNVDPEWMYVDLGAVQDLDSVIIHWEAAYASLYQLQVSNDATTWTTVYNETNPNRLNSYTASNLYDTIVAPTSNIRYVRMYGTARALPYGYSIWEFEIYSTPKYTWSPNDGSISDIHSASPTFTPAATTTYNVIAPNDCSGAVSYNMTITVDCSLPVELLSFDAVRVNDKAHITWSTALEVNTNYFTVMKSLDGKNFFPIGKVTAAGNSNNTKPYALDDPDLPANGTVYYQLLTTDVDGSSSNSAIRKLTLQDEGVFIQNPVFDEETALVVSSDTEWLQLTVVDAVGRVLLNERYTAVSGPIYFGKTLPPSIGFYVAIVQTATLNKTFKVVKRK